VQAKRKARPKNNDVSEERNRHRDAMQRWEHHGNIVGAGMILGTSWGWEGFLFVREVGCKWDVICKHLSKIRKDCLVIWNRQAPCSLCWVMCQAKSLLRQGQDRSLTLRSGAADSTILFKQFMFNRDFAHYYKWVIIMSYNVI
jgi:hypothetical protein